MNYRHAYHAGNFADVVKHAVLVRIVDYLKRKDKPFRVIDTHAGAGVYDLAADEADRTGEWRGGIRRLFEAEIDPEAATLLAPYLAAVTALNAAEPLRFYPGSPVIVRQMLRGRDRLTAIELHPEDAFALRSRFAADFQARVITLDGWLALGAHVPPKEKRGLVLVDPPFEREGEFDRIVDGLAKAHKRWPGGIYALWYPIKDHEAVARFRARLGATGIGRISDFWVLIRPPSPEPRLDGCGMIVVNPPHVLAEEMRTVLAALAPLLADRGGALWRIETIAGEAGSGAAG
ncbi:23S rRNA (adenine(2030)-N(6))-methyltransferase RlmJ [Nitratireductor mangrovi]|uniref:Ribosomal RNA large subunit methyltransferase J n=1 Tax=Nitratireductor mangrovi TaxID=2599600 RepID=A0A5B8KZ18_9HYPH|nr:23S rRNA (adenine(2030)-N(6))-methyltransferase RlmJ [Nitratireductor mangrovi]QDZ00987.1 23S rRNA (adenine(2030)-N(6))-methyltransferase RlmJ [Nitratireductor mangrovi]